MPARILLSLLAATVLLAQEREGDYWVRTIDGVVPMPAAGRLQVRTRGSIVVRGSQGDQVSYRLVERVKARSDVRTKDDPRRLFGEVTTATRAVGDLTRLVVMPVTAAGVITQLEVNVPRRITESILETERGGIEAYDLEGSLRAVTTGGLIHADRIRGSVVARTGGGEIRLRKTGGAVRCASGGGSIYIDSVAGEANCETAGGDVIVREAGGALALSTEGGNIRVERASSSVDAHSAAGLVEVSQAAGPVVADTRAGTVRVKAASGPMNVSTTAGSIMAELLAGMRIEESSLDSGSGDVTVLIPSHLALSVMARNDSGGNPRIVSDFEEVRAKILGFSRPPLLAEGAINGGGPVLRIGAAGGTIYLRRVK